jgi:hypothetical protein
VFELTAEELGARALGALTLSCLVVHSTRFLLSRQLLQRHAELCVAAFLLLMQLCAIHGKRVTLMVKDIQLARRLRGDRFDYIADR